MYGHGQRNLTRLIFEIWIVEKLIFEIWIFEKLIFEIWIFEKLIFEISIFKFNCIEKENQNQDQGRSTAGSIDANVMKTFYGMPN